MSRTTAAGPPLNFPELTNKLYDADSDIRYMSLSDLQTFFKSPVYASQITNDYNGCAKLVDGFLHTLNDPNGEVQNQTIKCIGPFVNKMHANILCPMIHKFTDLEKVESVDPSISALAVRAIVISLPRPNIGVARSKDVTEAYSAISKVLIPRLVGYLVFPHNDKSRPEVPKGLLQIDLEKGEDSNSIDVLTEVARCFGPMLQEEEILALQKITLQLLESNKTSSVMKKKAVAAMSALSHYVSSNMLSGLLSRIIEVMRTPHIGPPARRLYITLFGSFARAIPTKFGPHLKTVAPFVLAAVSQEELANQDAAVEEDEERDPQVDEVREAALLTLDTFLTCCGNEMERYAGDSADAALRFVKYDPIVVEEGDEEADEADDIMDGEDEFDLDEDFEQEGGADDEDDVSWKVRRCAAKLLRTIISVRSRDLLDNATSYERIASTLISRFKEREDSVRIEVLSTLGFLIRKTGEEERHDEVALAATAEQNVNRISAHSQTRKRRRANSDVSMGEARKYRRVTGSTSPELFTPPRNGPLSCLADINQSLVGGLLRLLKTSTSPTKQASITTLKDLVLVQPGSLVTIMDELLTLIAGAIKTTTPATQTSVGGSQDTNLQTEALHLLAEILKAHSSKTFQGQLPNLIACVTHTAQDRSPKLACEALSTMEQLVKAVTPPRFASTGQKVAAMVEQMRENVSSIIMARNVDLAVRQQAIHVLGIVLGRTMSTQGLKLLSVHGRKESFALLLEASRNETTRYASIKAINILALQAIGSKNGFDSEWLSKICLELGAQLRKADRALRGASVEALKTLVVECGITGQLDVHSTQELAALLGPLLTSGDLHLLGPALVVLAEMIRNADILNEHTNKDICQLVASPTANAVIDQLSMLAQAIGDRKIGAQLMQALLKDVGIMGSPSIVGKVIGVLLVSGQGSVNVTVEDFLKELKQTQDDRRMCLALSVLGEVGARVGAPAKQLSLQLFTTYFTAKSDEVRLSAANALGRAAAGPGNVKTWVPAILNEAKQNTPQQYLLLHAVRELLQVNENDKDIIPYAGALWDLAISAARNEDNRTIGAECIANLVMVDPSKLLPALQSLLSNQTTTVRGTAILAFRDVFTVTDSSYNKELRPLMVEVMTTMMRDSDVENRRAALNTFNSAARNKAELTMPHLQILLPLVLDHSHKDPSLIREVSMGPFKHTVDDGLEVRKNAYETLYSLLDVAPSRMDIVRLYDRIIAGIGDDRGIQTLCNLMTTQLITVAPEETSVRLEAIAEQFRTVLAFAPKETAVRPEIEKADEAKRGVIKVSLDLDKAFPSSVGQGSGAATAVQEAGGRVQWAQYLAYMRDKHSQLVKEVERKT